MGKLFFDQYSILHFATGIIAYFFKINLFWWFIIHTIFEIIENTPQGIHFINEYLFFWPGGKPYADSLINSIGDTIFSILGWLTGYSFVKFGKKQSLYQP